MDPIVGRDRHDLGAVTLEPVEEVVVRGKVEVLNDDLPSRTFVAEAGRNDRLRNGRVLVHRDRAWRCANRWGQQVSGHAADFPPTLMPRAHPTSPPFTRELTEIGLRPAGHRT